MNIRIAILGLGYVGLPLARLLATKYPVIGYDTNPKRILDLLNGKDTTGEVESSLLREVLCEAEPDRNGLFFSNTIGDISLCTYYIITVPTPIDRYKKPDLQPLIEASRQVGAILSKGDIVIYESTVYPGTTEEECIPILEHVSGLRFNVDFTVGYSPERVNPGDTKNTVENIKKVTSGSTPETASRVDQLYASVIRGGTYKASSIKVAEAAKVIENTQRDINIAFVNELAKIFHLLNIDTQEVLDAAATKWNFLPFKPGLVGGHCIGVDPYYLAQKAQEVGYHPEIILAGRRLNDSMGQFVASEVVKIMIQKDIPVKKAKVLVLGITFKENCADIRNTGVIRVIQHLQSYGVDISVHDPYADSTETEREYGIQNQRKLPEDQFDALILAVAHKPFLYLDPKTITKQTSVIYDVKGVWDSKLVDKRL